MDKDYGGTRGIIRPYPNDEAEARARGDKRALLYGGAQLQPFVCDLANARSLSELQIAGDVLYVDKLSTGTIGVRLDTQWQRSFPFGANSAMRGVPYRSILLEWEAQPGKTCVLWSGYGVEMIPPNQDITSIGSITDPVTVEVDPDSLAENGWSSYVSSTVLGTGGTEQVFAAGANAAGGIILSAQIWTARDATSLISLLLKNGAPTTNIDGIPVAVMGHRLTGSGTYSGELIARPRRFNSGTGLYFYNLNVETAGIRQVIYKLF